MKAEHRDALIEAQKGYLEWLEHWAPVLPDRTAFSDLAKACERLQKALQAFGPGAAGNAARLRLHMQQVRLFIAPQMVYRDQLMELEAMLVHLQQAGRLGSGRGPKKDAIARAWISIAAASWARAFPGGPAPSGASRAVFWKALGDFAKEEVASWRLPAVSQSLAKAVLRERRETQTG